MKFKGQHYNNGTDKVIKIDKTSRIRVEKRNFILEYREKAKNKKTGKESLNWVLDGYFGTIESLAEEWVQNAIWRSEEPVQDVKQLIKVIEDADNYMRKIFKFTKYTHLNKV